MYIEAKNLVKAYKNRNVVDDVSLRVEKGEIVGLLGPNGAGKTTTFYMIVGLESPTQGNVYLSDVKITKMPMCARADLGISYLAQEASIFRKLTVEENLLAILEMECSWRDLYLQMQERFSEIKLPPFQIFLLKFAHHKEQLLAFQGFKFILELRE